jgi:AcrR family transcriptional regulator
MNLKRTQGERTAATRAALIQAARELWSERGYSDVGTPEIAAAAGVTRGAMYHQFTDKADLFGAALEAVEVDVTQRLAEQVVASGVTEPGPALRAAADAWLDACENAEVRQFLLIDGPRVLGWAAFRDLTLRHGLGLTEQLLSAALGPERPTRALAHILIGALNEAAMYVASGGDREEVAPILDELLDGILRARTGSPSGPRSRRA